MAKLMAPLMILGKDNASFNVLHTKDELRRETNLWQAGQTTSKSSTVSLLSKELEREYARDDELGKENAYLKTQLLEVVADNEALSNSLQERAKSLADMTDAKFQAESESKVLQVQVKAMHKDMDAHRYELQLLRKQLQIKNAESEQGKRASDASHRQHLDNVKKIARLESECQRLRSLIRQKLPGPAAIVQMRAETEFHIRKQMVSSTYSGHTTRCLPNVKSSEHYERQIQALTDRLSSIEDEANFLKEALVKKTAELQEARQLCARTAMKLSSAQNLLEAMSTQPLEDDKSIPSTHSVYEGGNGIIDADEDREVICAESWASALVTELSYLSRAHGNDQCVSPHKHVNNPNQSDHEELDLQPALQAVRQKLSSVADSLVLSGLQPTEKNADGAMSSYNAQNCVNGWVNFDDILEEVSQVKHLLLELGRAMERQDELQKCREAAAAGSSSSSLTQDPEKIDGISKISMTDSINPGTLTASDSEDSSCTRMAPDMHQTFLALAHDEDAIFTEDKKIPHEEELEQLLEAAQAQVEASHHRISALEADLQQSFNDRDNVAKALSETCTLKDNLEADLAKARADMEELRSSELLAAVEDAGQHQSSTNTLPSGDRTPTHVCSQSIFTNSDPFCIANEGEEIGVARAQLAYCQHCIGMLREQLKLDVQSQASLDMTSSSSKSTNKSTSSSPTSADDMDFASPSLKHIIDLKSMKHKLLYLQPSMEYSLDLKEEKTCDFSHDERFIPSSTISIDDSKSHEETKKYELSMMATHNSKTMESISKDHVSTQVIPSTKPIKLSTSMRLVEFFNKARMHGGNP